MSTELDIRVSPALHPDNVKEIDGYDAETALVLGPTVEAFEAAYRGVGAVHDAREASKRDPTLNEAAQIIRTDDLAQRVFAKVARGFDAVRGNLVAGIAHIEKELSGPVEIKAAHPIAAQIRDYARALPAGKVHSFLQEAMQSGDHETLTAILGAPAYLSGLTPEFKATYLRHYHEQNSPQLARRLKVMQGAKTLIEERAGIVHGALEAAVGAAPHKARALREAKSAADKHFATQGS
jgi:hypothetical protein